jgi:hypothetical protein
MKTLELILTRTLGFPFFFVLALIGVLFLFGKYMINYVRFGGEAIAYTAKTQRKTINDVFIKLTEQHEN